MVDVPTNIIIPKIWDYAYVRYKNVDLYSSYYDYINELPNHDDVEYRENDVFIFLQDLDYHLRLNGILHSKFNKLDLDTIRCCQSNTEAINEYFHQNPIIDNSNNQNIIIHTFKINV